MKKRAAIAAAALALAGAGSLIKGKPPTVRHTSTHALCWKRPTGAPVESCLMPLPDGGTRDQGDENVLRAGAVGAGCVATKCGVMQGQKP